MIESMLSLMVSLWAIDIVIPQTRKNKKNVDFQNLVSEPTKQQTDRRQYPWFNPRLRGISKSKDDTYGREPWTVGLFRH